MTEALGIKVNTFKFTYSEAYKYMLTLTTRMKAIKVQYVLYNLGS